MGADRQVGYRDEGIRPVAAQINSQTDPDYSSFEEAEAAFMKLLKRVGAQPEWSWEQTMRATVKDPQYRALKDPRDRKAAFEKYCVEVRAQEKEREKDRQAKLRADYGTMLRSHPEIKYYTRWQTARSIIERETVFRSAKSEEERKALFNDYRNELYKKHTEDEFANHKSAMDELMTVLAGLHLEPYTRWSDAQTKIQEDERFQGDNMFQSLSKLDILKAFEDHIKALERSLNDKKQTEKSQKTRRERQARDNFVQLLSELKQAGKIKAGTKWMEIHALIEDDPRYVTLLGQHGSTALDLFWDMVEEEENKLRTKRNDVLDVLDVSTAIDHLPHHLVTC